MNQPLGSSYILGERLGGGAMGTVYKARDHQGQEYAVKVLRSELAEEPELVQRFVQESSALTSIEHPDVVGMHDLVIEGSTLAIVMDLVPGHDLRTEIRRRGSLPPAEAARIAAGVASGLAAVHRAGLVHRDVKPENVLLDTTVEPPTPKVTDFGIARIADASAATRSSMMVGTPNYMAPEIAEGATPTPAVDSYALGILLYEMCAGLTPFEGGNYVAVIKRHAESAPGRPDGMPDEIWDVIRDLLAKDPASRPSAGQVVPYLTDLSFRLRGTPAAPALSEAPLVGLAQTEHAPRPVSTEPSAPSDGELAPRRSVLMPALLGLGLAAVVAAAAIWWFGLRENDSDVLDDAAAVTAMESSGTDTAAEQAAESSTDAAGTDEATTPASAETTTTESVAPETTTEEATLMPDLVGQTLSQARTQLSGTTVSVVEEFDEDARDNEVSAQSAAAGEPVPDEVELTVTRQPVTIYLDQMEIVASSGNFSRFKSRTAELGGEFYPRSMAVADYSQSSTSWNLSRGFRTLRMTLGRSDDASDAETQVQVEFFLDQRSVQTEIVSFGEPVELELDVTDALRLEIVATALNGDSSYIVLGDARLLGLPSEVPELEDR